MDPHSHSNDLYYTHANYCLIPPRANDLYYTTLEFRIVVLALIIVLVGKFPKFNNRPVPYKRTGWIFS